MREDNAPIEGGTIPAMSFTLISKSSNLFKAGKSSQKGKKKKCCAKKKSYIYIYVYSCNVLENYHNIILFYLNMKIDYNGNYLPSFLWLYLDMKLCVIASSIYYDWVWI